MTHSLDNNENLDTPQDVDGPDGLVDAPSEAPAEETDEVADETPEGDAPFHEVEGGFAGNEAKFKVTEYKGETAYQPLINPEDNPTGSYDPTADDTDARLDNRAPQDKAPEEAYAPVPQNVPGPEIGGARTDNTRG
jgi:hypothetical protein